jgi:predicted esterase
MRTGLLFALFVGSLLTSAPDASGARIILKNGTILEGEVGRLGTLIANPTAGHAPPPGGELIVLVDDSLRRTYVSFHEIQEVQENVGPATTRFEVPHQPVARGGKRLASLGRVRTEKWDDHGWRTMSLTIPDGKADIIQGITLITPTFFRVQTLRGGRLLLLDQRYATGSLPTPLLRKILYRCIDAKDPDDRLRVYRFFLEADRYVDAKAELDQIIEDFPKLDLQQQWQTIRNLMAQRGLTELQERREAGQHEFARRILEGFPSEGIAGEILLEVREILAKYESIAKRTEKLREDLRTHLGEVRKPDQRELLEPIVSEMCAEVNSHTLPRFASYLQLARDPDTPASTKLALAVSGWLVGGDDATDNLPVALSLVEVRRLVREYLTSDLKPRRNQLITLIRSQEGGVPRLVAEVLAHMKPPLPLPDSIEGVEGFHQVTVPGRGGLADVTYLVQLPPEYDPYRRYPAVITLHGAGTNAALQVDWWAGGLDDKGRRQGQGSRHGYIVIAPNWANVQQQRYEYSGREHAAVLDTLRDACRRFSIDTDRVFLSGHSMGGDAAWDIGLAHPDMWAGVIPIVATADSNRYTYNTLYWRNCKSVPFYFVGGELDGNKWAKNAYQFDRYLRHIGHDVTIVNLQGRGHESFSDEILNLYAWMNRMRRDFFPKQFACETIRSWDNYFWWVEINQMPATTVADPENWPPRRIKTLNVTGRINVAEDMTTVRVSSGRGATTIWLSPDLVDFDQRIRIVCSGFRSANGPSPDIAVMLEDARTRGDRLHPFWARIDFP